MVLGSKSPAQFFAVHVNVGVAGAGRMRLVHQVGREPEPLDGDANVNAAVRVRFRGDDNADGRFRRHRFRRACVMIAAASGHVAGGEHVEVDGKSAGRRCLENQLTGMAGRHVCRQVVPVQVNLTGLVCGDGEAHGLTLGRSQICARQSGGSVYDGEVDDRSTHCRGLRRRRLRLKSGAACCQEWHGGKGK